MLRKLIRYDSKIQFRFLGSLMIVSVLASLFSGIAGRLYEAYPEVMALGIFKMLTLGFSILVIAAMLFGNFIYVVVYFRKNLFRDEGYLMHTLPVTETQLFCSKIITGTLCVYLSGIAAYICFCIGTWRLDYFGKFVDIIRESGVQGTKTVVLVLLMFLLLVPITICQFYAALTVGYTWKINSGSHINRDLLSVLSYIVLYMVQQMLGLISILLYFIFNGGITGGLEAFMEKSTGLEVTSYVQGIIGMAFAMEFVLGIILIVIILQRFHHHLNLE